MDFERVMLELESLATPQAKKNYRQNGAREPFFGVPTGKMKPLGKKIKGNQATAEQLYQTGNYDAMYLAGMIADTDAMTEADFERWMDGAYFFMISDYIVAVTLAETGFAQGVADRWIKSGEELRMSAGWRCYEWLLGSCPDGDFDRDKLLGMLETVRRDIHTAPGFARCAMNGFVAAVGVSYVPLHDEAFALACEYADSLEKPENVPTYLISPAKDTIKTADEKGRLGFKRKNVRC